MNIPDKAVEAAEWAVTNYVIAADEKEYQGSSDITPEELRRVYLETAAPYLYAQALRDAADEIAHEIVPGDGWDRRSIDVELLRTRADELDPHE